MGSHGQSEAIPLSLQCEFDGRQPRLHGAVQFILTAGTRWGAACPHLQMRGGGTGQADTGHRRRTNEPCIGTHTQQGPRPAAISVIRTLCICPPHQNIAQRKPQAIGMPMKARGRRPVKLSGQSLEEEPHPRSRRSCRTSQCLLPGT